MEYFNYEQKHNYLKIFLKIQLTLNLVFPFSYPLPSIKEWASIWNIYLYIDKEVGKKIVSFISWILYLI